MELKFLQRFRAKRVAAPDFDLEAISMAAARALHENKFHIALRLYGEVIEHRPDHTEAFYKRANAHNALGQWESALADYDRAIALDPAHAHAYCNRGTVLERLERWNQALASYDRAIALQPDDFRSFYNRGSALKELERYDEALASYDRAIELRGDYAAAYINRGNVLHKLRRYEAALASYDRAIELGDALGEAYHARGVALVNLRRFQDALADFDSAISIKPGYVEAYTNRGSVLQEAGQHDAALASYAKAIDLDPECAAAHHGRGFSLMRLQKFEAAIESYDKAMAVEADRRYLLGMRLYAQMQICDWRNLAPMLEKLASGLQARKPWCVPIPLLALTDAPALHRSVAEAWVQNECPRDEFLGPIPMRARSARIRIGYFSSDFCEHAVSLLTAQLFEMHDRSRFETIAFAFGPRPNDSMRRRLRKAFDQFIEVRDQSDAAVALMARNLGIDIAVDLNGHTEYSRPNIFALRAAPIQVNCLGYPGTTGAGYMDYLVADRIVVPEALQPHYTEKIIYLPNSFLPYDATREIAPKQFTRDEMGLPAEGFVFCCFNNSYKIMPEVFSSWMRILRRTESGVLWLAQNDAATARNLRREAESMGVSEERLIFCRRTDSLAEHLARMACADLFLDTLPYNAHATAADALWAGLPMLTRRGESFAARVASSLLTAIGLPELIATTEREYEDLAVALAAAPLRLRNIRLKLHENRTAAPLFNTRLFANHLQSAYESLYERYLAGLPPEHLFVRE